MELCGIMRNYAEFHNFRMQSWYASATPHRTGLLSPKNAKRNVNEIAEFRLGNCVVDGFKGLEKSEQARPSPCGPLTGLGFAN